MDYRPGINKLKKRDNAGFTLLESLVALYVLTFGIVGALSVAQQGLASASTVRRRLEATNLAREGIELIHNRRASNARLANEFTCPASGDFQTCLENFDQNEEDMYGIATGMDRPCLPPNGCMVWWGFLKSGVTGMITLPQVEFIQCGTACEKLRLQGDGTYTYANPAGSEPSIYTRTILVDRRNMGGAGRSEWLVISRVEWDGRFGHVSVEATSYLSPWL